MNSSRDDRFCNRPGCPIRKSTDQRLLSGSPWLIAAFYVLHRLLAPRHSPQALSSLITKFGRFSTASQRIVIYCPDTMCSFQRTQPKLNCSAFTAVVVGVAGVEPATLRLSSACSNQLSYTPAPCFPRFLPAPAFLAGLVEPGRVELPTFCLQSRRSTTELRPRLDGPRLNLLEPSGLPSLVVVPKNSLLKIELCDKLEPASPFGLVDLDAVLFLTQHRSVFLLRKEVIQPQVPLRLPCYDFIPITSHTFGACLLAVGTATSGTAGFHDVTGGVYKARERIHGAVADAPLLAIPASCRRVAADNLN